MNARNVNSELLQSIVVYKYDHATKKTTTVSKSGYLHFPAENELPLEHFCIPIDPILALGYFRKNCYYIPLLLTQETGSRLYGASLIHRKESEDFMSYGVFSYSPVYTLFYELLMDMFLTQRDYCIEAREYISALPVFPVQEDERVRLSVELYTRTVVVQTYPLTDLHIIDTPINNLLNHISFSETVKLLKSLLFEQRVIIVSDDVSLLTPLLNTLCSMLNPFSWKHVLIPVLPNLEQYHTFLNAPLPYLIGVSSLPLSQVLDPDIVIFDLNKRSFINVSAQPEFPSELFSHLRRAVKLIIPRWFDECNSRKFAVEPSLRVSARIRLAFFHFLIEILTRCPKIMDPTLSQSFFYRKTGFTIREKCEFIKVFSNTQLFQTYQTESESTLSHCIVKEGIHIIKERSGALNSMKAIFGMSDVLAETLTTFERTFLNFFIEKSTILSSEPRSETLASGE
ncbi:hypothetical protein XU18_1749 [Perkinsela sp. CCAP 1560/4]|nr:hypothetical protein XU18_2930 [Perkinsela sp. CCAP 1560/4]KNH07655.1 hypothetical protein XU18_1749 [Perkinsela sp. CCAP 1560/4]|eukprot:KNH06174.1 hypothetical protein XU18_2930 [Perkinsela sp. CCAP 1560/4]